MAPLTQRIIGLTLVTLIKGIAITGLIADVVFFYGHKQAYNIKAILKKKIRIVRTYPSHN